MKLRPAKPRELERILNRLGFRQIRQRGSHAVFRHPDGRWTSLTVHHGRDIPEGTLRDMIKDMGITVEQFEEMR
ncbi:MAG: type II toxin-antitoxin system HicA family toxin [Acidobacteria bacterium]|nr:type II toxin-antitoxin system HicA family toxin [Acidobacteriota bacterium]